MNEDNQKKGSEKMASSIDKLVENISSYGGVVLGGGLFGLFYGDTGASTLAGLGFGVVVSYFDYRNKQQKIL